MSMRERPDFDSCSRPHCRKIATMTDRRIDLDYCSRNCADKHIEDLQWEAELERLAEISSGGQI